ncbi:25703_t:CDS:2, partial [Dentiscutata erythropus]
LTGCHHWFGVAIVVVAFSRFVGNDVEVIWWCNWRNDFGGVIYGCCDLLVAIFVNVIFGVGVVNRSRLEDR